MDSNRLLLSCIFISVIYFVQGAVDTSRQYLATLHHPPTPGYINKRNVENSQFVGNLIVNDTLNENGEITISLCDITEDLFGGLNNLNMYTVFDEEASGSIGSIVSADVSASVKLNVNLNGCLQFFFNPCCETVGMRIVLEDPVTLSATASIGVHMEAFGIGGGTKNIDIDPLQGFNIAGFSPVIGSWGLPPILDSFTNTKVTNEKFCAGLHLPMDSSLGLDFCIELNDFSASIYGVNVCPRLVITLGNILPPLLNVSYTSIVGGDSECLNLNFIPQCSHNGATVQPNIIQLFKSIDVNNDFKITVPELDKSKALLGIFGTQNANTASFAQLDQNGDGDVDFTEFQTYTAVQNQTYATDPYAKSDSKKTFSGGDIALAVIMTTLGTGLVVAAALIIFAQHKGLIKNELLGKVIPTKV